MLRLWLFILALYTLALSPAAAFLPGQPVGMLNPQALPANASAGLPAVDDDLTANGYPVAGGRCAEWGHLAPCNNHYSTTRASTKYVTSADGLLTSVPNNTLALGNGNGALIEEFRTNDALWARDMTNAAWVKTTMTTALNAAGVDGTANAATRLTATAGNAMAVQTITLSSQADNYSVYLKRVTGSGTINLCLAATACGTATACTVTSTTTFTRCTVTATVLNPIVGIQIATNGDAVIADFNQMEPGGSPTSPVLTTSATAARSADVVTPVGSAVTILKGAVGTIVATTNSAGQSIVNNPRIIGISAGTSFFSHLYFASTGKIGSYNGTTNLFTANSVTATARTKSGLAWVAAGGRVLATNGSAAAIDALAFNVAIQTPQIGGGDATSSEFYDGYTQQLTGYTTNLSSTLVSALTQ